MKIMRIKDNKGQFLMNPFKISGTPSDFDYKSIDLIEKEDILELLTYIIDNDVEIDSYDPDDPLPNPVHDVIYRNLAVKFNDVNVNKETIKKEINDKFLMAENKYNNQ